MKALKVFVVALAVLSVCSVTSAAEFFDDFESYVAGDGLHGQNNWEGWDGAISADSPASDAYAYSGSMSVEIINTADLVQPFDVAGGQWVLSGMMYAPSGTTGETMWIVLNAYPENKDWSIQATFNLGTGAITSAGGTATIIYDEWVEIKNIIDLDNNTVDEYYNGELLATHEWDDDPDNPPGIGCLDLFGNSASSVYYDDITLQTLDEYQAIPTNPSPAMGAEDVARDTDLSWTAGETAVTHDVYFGADYATVASATRADAMGVLIAQDIQTASVALDQTLELGTTYYWRADPMRDDGTIQKGPVWSFVVEPAFYGVQNVAATTNAISVEGEGPENTVNGSGLDAAGQHSVDTADMWTADPNGDDPIYIQWEFDDVYPIAEMDVWNHNFIFEMALGIGIKEATLETSTDGIEWSVFGDVVLAQATGQPTYTANTIVDLQDTPAKYVRLTANGKYGPSPQYGLSEVRFLYSPKAARQPVPADGATDVAVDTELNWRPGREAVSHDVYLGTDPNILVLDGTTTEHVYGPALDLDMTYYWQVVEVNEAETPSAWASNIWTFITEEHILVEGFESYTDNVEAEETIWQTWIDGVDDSTKGGSTVGYDQSPFAEQTTVYAGAQSMPLRYDNSGVGFSETTRTFATAQDWSLHGITTLTVRFKGALDAAITDQLYVKVNGTKVVYDGDLTSPIWLPFNVDLTSLGVNLSSVSSLTIGVEGTGSGTLFVDDIALYRIAPIDPATSEDKTLVAHWKLDETEGLTAADSSGYGNDGTLLGFDGTEWTTGINGGALAFAGGSSANPTYVNFGDPLSLQLNGSVTMSAWVKMEEGNDGVYMGIGGKLISGTYKGFALVRHSSNVFRLWANSTDNQLAGFDASSDETYTDTEWHHVVGVVDAGTSMLYVDGVKQSIEGTVDLVDSTTYAYIGKQYGDESSHRYWNGLIDDVRIYYRALSAQEIAGL